MLLSSWVTTMMAMPKWAFRLRTNSSNPRAVIWSSPAESSSKSSSAGSKAKARATAARFFIPPLISDGSRWAARSRPTSASFMRASVRAVSGSAWVCSMIGRATFSARVSELNKAPPWNDMPTLRKIASCSSSDALCTSRPSISPRPFGAPADVKPAITGDQPNQHSEDHALHHAGHQIADEEGLGSLLQVITAPEPQQRRPHPVAAENARQVGEHGQAGHRTQERQDTREQEKTARVQGHGPHGINFLCHHHGAQLGGDGRAAAAGHDDGGNQRRHFPSHRYADQVGDINRGAKLTQLTGAIERQDGTDEEGEERDDWHSLYADLHDLFKRAVPFDPLAA